MSRRIYVSLFVTLAICFVPVLLYLGMVNKIVPFVVLVVGAFHDGFFLGAPEIAVLVFHVLFYGAFFYGLARLTYWLTSRVASKPLRTCVQAAILIGVFATSFIPVLQQDTLAGRSGNHTFWSALGLYVEK